MERISRQQIKERFRVKILDKKPIILAGAGCGIAARAEETAGADLIMAYNTGIYRMDGHVSLVGYRYYSNGNEDSLNLARELNASVHHTPVVAGVAAEDPFISRERLLTRLMDLGYSGITNVPSIAGASKSNSSVFGNDCRYYGYGSAAEVELIKFCDRNDIYTAMYAYNEEDIRSMCAAGVDLLSVHVGGTAGGSTGSLGERLLSLEAAAEMTERCYEIAMQEKPDLIMVTHGGPFEDPEAMEYCFLHAHCHGYIGASGIERIPVEKKLEELYSEYRGLRLR